MFAVYLLSLLAIASAAPFNHDHPRGPPPHFPPPRHGHYHHHGEDNGFFGEDIFDTGRFWDHMTSEMHRLDEMLNDFSKHFPTASATQGLNGNEYKITITLPGFDEKDVVVKAREGVLMIQAVHKSETGISEKTYTDLRTLPSYVNVSGSWSYDKGILTVVFPVKQDAVTEVTEEIVTQQPEQHSREDMDKNENNNNQDADVGAEGGQGDRDKEEELLTNAIPSQSPVEATTYAVDLKNEVEFVPVRY